MKKAQAQNGISHYYGIKRNGEVRQWVKIDAENWYKRSNSSNKTYECGNNKITYLLFLNLVKGGALGCPVEFVVGIEQNKKEKKYEDYVKSRRRRIIVE